MEARLMCPNLLVVPPNYQVYVRASKSLYELLNTFSPDIEVFSIDECFIRFMDLNKEKAILLIDHQPREFAEIKVAGVDVTVSGHTHKGQLFPGNLITKAIYENHYGYLITDELHTIVSSGFGIWGPPFRIGSRSEVVEINIKFIK